MATEEAVALLRALPARDVEQHVLPLLRRQFAPVHDLRHHAENGL